MHEAAYRFIADMVTKLEPRYSVIELGARIVAGNWAYSGPVRSLFTNAREYIGVDIAPGPNVNLVDNAATVTMVPGDTVVCCETLEHTPEAEEICHNAWRLLEDGGVFLMTTAGEGRVPHSAVDGGPIRDGEFYRNVTRDDLRIWLKPFRFFLIDRVATDIRALAVK